MIHDCITALQPGKKEDTVSEKEKKNGFSVHNEMRSWSWTHLNVSPPSLTAIRVSFLRVKQKPALLKDLLHCWFTQQLTGLPSLEKRPPWAGSNLQSLHTGYRYVLCFTFWHIKPKLNVSNVKSPPQSEHGTYVMGLFAYCGLVHTPSSPMFVTSPITS